MKHILLVEDDLWLAELYQDVLELDERCKVHRASSADDAFSLLDAHKIDLIILDMFLPGHNGIEFLHELASYGDLNKMPVIVLSGMTQIDIGMSAERWSHYGVVQYMYKPQTKPKDLIAAVKKQLTKARS